MFSNETAPKNGSTLKLMMYALLKAVLTFCISTEYSNIDLFKDAIMFCKYFRNDNTAAINDCKET